MLSCLLTVATAGFYFNNVQALDVKIVLDGVERNVSLEGDLCSIIAAVDSAIAKSALPFSAIEVVPEHWNIYIKGTSIPVSECEQHESVLESLNLEDGEHVYVFRNENAYHDPYFAAEYVKTFAKSFGERIRPLTKTQEGSKKAHKYHSKSKKRKSRSSGSEEISALVGLLAKSFLTGNLGQAFGMDKHANSAEHDANASTGGDHEPKNFNVLTVSEVS
ncbi:uncharacterized protein BXIN_3016 [Babesia sp. Xinjiang]|uniref:uncharacterized protein n=1 Tax=Babesia sp. Xinjiang TaxID=462227 RepID=UPI000A243957|nr:uncharacterized protein BXIN_3016 [Babesia sp. Xinjiang]ORM39367.1 hypothetical protein BXIN_3016 [Babesia sp. Xinjiang]